MKITLLDPGLQGTGGHHFDLDLRLAQALARRGHEVEIHAYTQPDPALLERARALDIAVQTTFRIPTYARIPCYQPPRWEYTELIAPTVEDLKQVKPSDLWFWPTLAPYQLAAAVSQQHTVRQLCAAWWLPQKPVPANTDVWAHTADILATHDYPIQVGAYDSSLCYAYTGRWPELDIHILPCPHDGTDKTTYSRTVERIGFFGHQRDNRGLQLLPELVGSLLTRGFEVVVQNSSNNSLSLPDHPRLIRLPYIDNFAQAIAECDLVVWPSQPETYQSSWSGVISESVATGVPVVAADHCLPGELVARYGCGVLFDAATPQSILAAVDQAVQTYPQLVIKAQHAAADWQASNGTERLVVWLENYASQQAEQPTTHPT